MHPFAAGVMSGWWCILMHANLLFTHAKQCLSINTGPFVKPRVSKSTRIHWRTQKCGQTSGQMHGIYHTNQSKIQGDLQIMVPAAFGFCLAAASCLGVVMACKCIHHPEWGCADQSMKVSMYFQMLVDRCLGGWLAGLLV